LADALARNPVAVADLGKGFWLAIETHASVENIPFAIGESAERALHGFDECIVDLLGGQDVERAWPRRQFALQNANKMADRRPAEILKRKQFRNGHFADVRNACRV